jgi:hypothetical protein
VIRVSQILFWFGMTMMASLVLYHTSDRVHVLDHQLHDLNARIEDEQKSLHVLKAEWVYLANPSRLEATAHKFLALRPTAPRQIVRMDELAESLPGRGDAVASISVTASPIASLRSTLATLPARIAASIKTAHVKTGTMAVASADTGHINDRMIMERTASTTPSANDAIATLITNIGAHP